MVYKNGVDLKMGFLCRKREKGNFDEESSIRSKVVEYEWIKQTFSSTVSYCVDINRFG